MKKYDKAAYDFEYKFSSEERKAFNKFIWEKEGKLIKKALVKQYKLGCFADTLGDAKYYTSRKHYE